MENSFLSLLAVPTLVASLAVVVKVALLVGHHHQEQPVALLPLLAQVLTNVSTSV